MHPSASEARDHEWFEYYERFPYFSAEAVRDGCHPRIMEHEGPTAKAIVLVHGLTDSPYFLTAIGDYFFRHLGFHVYMPLLQGHGLKEPKGMEGVDLDEWKANVNFAVDIAASKANRIAIGGFSTGGALSFYTAMNNPKINGTLYLFSATLDLANGVQVGELKELLAGLSMADLLDFFYKDRPRDSVIVKPKRTNSWIAEREADRPKRINAWIAEREADRQRPLIIRQPYTLNLNVGEPHTSSLIADAICNVPLSEIPDEGLETVWIVTSDSVELAVAPPDNNVEVDAADAPASWTATFALSIPKSGESDTRQLRVTPRAAQGVELGIVILARSTLYRQFRIELNVEKSPLIGDDPYRYARIDLDGARELSKLIQETDTLINGFTPTAPLSKRIFAAHSESDMTANITGIEDLQRVTAPGQFTFFRIPKQAMVSHSSLVLKDPIFAIGASVGDKPLEQANPLFQDMMEAIAAIEGGGSPSSEGGGWPSAVRVAGDVEHVRLGYTGLMPQHEWQTPRGTLNICVIGNGKANVSGYVWNAAKQRMGWVGTYADWNLPLPRLAGPIRNVRDSADKFRRTFSDELNNIDQRDLEDRLSHFKTNTDTFWEDNRADAVHTQVWEQKIATSQELFDLAYYGYELYKTFFPDNTKLRLWLDSLEPDWRVNITWSENIDPNRVAHVPWGLLYTRPPEQGQPVDPMYFWELRYRFNYLAHDSDSGLSPALGGLNATASAHGFYWGDDDQEIVEEVKWQQAEWAKWSNQMFVPDSKLADSPKQQVLALLNKPPLKPTPVLYFFCHCDMGDGNKPVLRFGKTKDPSDNIKQTDLRQIPFESGPLVFINACASAASDPYIANELEQTFFERGCRSYLGTVVKVPIRFASRFAKIFYSFFFRDLAPEPVAAGEAVFQARRFLWREYRNIGGLLYAYINMYEVYMATESEVDALHGHQ